MPQDDSSPIKDEKTYEALRRDGASEEKAARIANAAAASSRSEVGRRGGESEPYDEWTRDELLSRARELDLDVTTESTKDELISALREH